METGVRLKLERPIIATYARGDTQEIIDLTYREASMDQERTTVRVDTADCKIYQPWRVGHTNTLYEAVRRDCCQTARDIFGEEYWVARDIWGLVYEDNDSADAHIHPNADYTAIWFMEADDGCGTLEYFDPDLTIEPKKNMLVIADAMHTHGVFPNVERKAKRSCIVMNIHHVEKVLTLDNKRGFYSLEGEGYDLDKLRQTVAERKRN